MSDNFNYEDADLNEDEEMEDDSYESLMDMLQQNEEDEDDNEDDDDNEGNNEEDDGDSEGSDKKKKDEDKESSKSDDKKDKPKDSGDKSSGRYGDTPPSQKPNKPSKPSSPKPGEGGGDNWFSKLANKFKGGKGAGGKATSKEGGKAVGKAASKAVQLLSKVPWQVWVVLAIIIVIILLILIISSAISSIIAFIDEKSDPENMQFNEFITSDYFYGLRVAYIDDEALTNSLQLSYKQYVVDVLSTIETDNPDISISFTLPTEFDNTTQVDQHINNLSLGIANIVATGSNTYAGIDFATLYPEIEYFGLTQEQGEQTTDFMINYFSSNSILSSSNTIDVTAVVESAVESEELQYIYILCEKVMIKDEICDIAGLSNIQQRRYVGSVYMACTNITINSASIVITNPSEDFTTSVKVIHEKNGDETIHCEETLESNSDIFNSFTFGKVELNKFTSIDETNTLAFNQGLSLFDAMKLSPEYQQYFTQNSESKVYSWKPTDTNLYYIVFESVDKFIFSDFNMSIELS